MVIRYHERVCGLQTGMHLFENQTGEGRPARLAGGIGSLPGYLLLSVLLGLVFLGLVTAGNARASSGSQPPMILPSNASASSTGAGTGSSGWIVGGIPGPTTDRIAESVGASEIGARLGSYRVPRDGANRLASRLRSAGQLVYAEPDVPVTRSGYPTDKYSAEQWWLDRIVNPGDVTPPAVTGQSPLIAVVEESLDPLHPDLLAANLTGSKSLDPDADWHGTAIAGIIGSPGEDQGIRGVWPGARMQLFASGLTCSTASKAVTKAANKGAAVINMSYTLPARSCFTHFVATQYAVRKGSIPVAAAGNSGDSGNAPMRPAVDPHVISVGAVDDKSVLAPFSTRNAGVDIVAPGASVYAPNVRQNAGGIERTWDYLSGTSFAAPMVSATAAWLKQARPELGNLQIASLLTSSATDLGEPGRDSDYGEGLLSIESSLTAPNPPLDPYEPNDDIKWINGTLVKPKSPFLWKAGVGKRRLLNATLSRAKDPADVYRVMIPARRRIVVNVGQLEGDIVLSALKPQAKSISKPGKNLIVRSNRPYPKTEGIVVRNLKKRAQTIWLALTPSSTQAGNDTRYRIKVVRR